MVTTVQTFDWNFDRMCYYGVSENTDLSLPLLDMTIFPHCDIVSVCPIFMFYTF